LITKKTTTHTVQISNVKHIQNRVVIKFCTKIHSNIKHKVQQLKKNVSYFVKTDTSLHTICTWLKVTFKILNFVTYAIRNDNNIVTEMSQYSVF